MRASRWRSPRPRRRRFARMPTLSMSMLVRFFPKPGSADSAATTFIPPTSGSSVRSNSSTMLRRRSLKSALISALPLRTAAALTSACLRCSGVRGGGFMMLLCPIADRLGGSQNRSNTIPSNCWKPKTYCSFSSTKSSFQVWNSLPLTCPPDCFLGDYHPVGASFNDVGYLSHVFRRG